MEVPKIQFSGAEEELMTDATIILTKNRIMEKMRGLLQEVQDAQWASLEAGGRGAHPLFQVPAKISRGENYLGLPWLILDYPRIFRAEGIAAVRSMFWWGRCFSSTLHLSGPYAAGAASNIWAARELLAGKSYYLGIHDDPWNHHFGPDNYRTITGTEPETAFSGRPHLKIAANWPVAHWRTAGEKFLESWKLLLEVSGLIT